MLLGFQDFAPRVEAGFTCAAAQLGARLADARTSSHADDEQYSHFTRTREKAPAARSAAHKLNALCRQVRLPLLMCQTEIQYRTRSRNVLNTLTLP